MGKAIWRTECLNTKFPLHTLFLHTTKNKNRENKNRRNRENLKKYIHILHTVQITSIVYEISVVPRLSFIYIQNTLNSSNNKVIATAMIITMKYSKHVA